MNKKSIAGLLVLAVLAPNCGGGGAPSKNVPPPIPKWGTQQRVPTSSDLRTVIFANLGVGLIAGKDGTIFRTGDGGVSWLQEDFTPTNRTGDIAAMAGLNLKVVAVGADGSGGRDWTSNDTLTWTTADAPGSNAPYTDVALGAGGFGPLDPVDTYRLRRDGLIHFTSKLGPDNFPGVSTGAWTNANGIVYVAAISASYVCGDIGGAGRMYLSPIPPPGTWPGGTCTIPANTGTFRRVIVSSVGQPFACGDNNAGNGIVVYVASQATPEVWSAVPYTGPALPSFQAISWPHSVYGYVVGNNGAVYRIFYNSTNATWTWTDLNPGGLVTGENLYGVFFVDADRGWIVGDKGTVLRTVNATSATGPWLTKISGGDAGIFWNALSFSDDGLRGLAVGNGAANAAKIYRTINGGATWTPMANPAGLTNQNLNGVSVPRTGAAGTTAYICGASGMLFKNTDVWNLGVWDNTLITGTSGTDTYRAILFPQPGKGVVVGNNAGTPLLLRTSDGLAWTAPTPGGFTLPTATYNALSSNPAGTAVYASGGNGKINVSTDLASGWLAWGDAPTFTGLPAAVLSAVQSPEGTLFTALTAGDNGNVYRLNAGGTWSAQTGSPWAAAKPISLGSQGDLEALVVTDAGTVYYTIDGGANWTLTYPHTKAKARAIWMSPTVPGLGYVGCDDGVILKTFSSGH